MRKSTTLDRPGQDTIKADLPQDLTNPSITPDLLPVIAQEKANRLSRSRQLEVLEYQPDEQDSARPLLSGWHLLFFARAGNEHIQDLRAALQQERGRDVQLMQHFKRVQAQYRQYMAQSSQSVSESVASQAVIAEICYGGLSIASGFWLPADMDMGVSLLPSTGGRLAADAFTVVEHYLDAPSASLDVLMVTLPSPRTKAELAAWESALGDGLDVAREKHVITLSTPVLAFVGGITAAIAGAAAEDYVAAIAVATVLGYKPTSPPSEGDIVNLQAKLGVDLSNTPSASRLLEARYQLMTRKVARTR